MARSAPKERRLPFRAPVRAWALSEWALLPLRLFLGATFTFAGLQKLANPNFFRAQSPTSIQAQLIAATHTSPLRPLLEHLVHLATPIGFVIAFAELAIGVGALLGLWMRGAAIGGAILSLTLFLVVSFHASPYYTGADIVFFVAWLPFIVSGGGSSLSLDSWIAKRAAKSERRSAPALVALPFAQVQKLCGNFDHHRCRAREGLACDAAVCPVLLGDRAPLVTRVSIDSVDRRALVVGSSMVAIVGVGTLLLGGAVAEAGRLIGGAKSPATTPQLNSGGATPSTGSGSASTPGTALGPASDVGVNGSATFTIPISDDPGLVIQLTQGQFYAYNAVCPHAGCTVGYYAASQTIVCPCHGSEFQVTTGDVIQGPATRGLTKLKVVEGSNGDLYLQ